MMGFRIFRFNEAQNTSVGDFIPLGDFRFRYELYGGRSFDVTD